VTRFKDTISMKRLGIQAHYPVTVSCGAGFIHAKAPGRIGEVEMFARKVSVLLKPNSLPEFTNLVEREILPWLRKQEGFLDLIVLAAPGGGEVATISFWDHQADAESYNASGYPEVLEILQRLLDGVPYLKTFDVVSSTLQRVTSCSGREGNLAWTLVRPDLATAQED
jgi:hypothetical protein